MPYDVEEEVALLVGHIKRLSSDGESVTFKVLGGERELGKSLGRIASLGSTLGCPGSTRGIFHPLSLFTSTGGRCRLASSITGGASPPELLRMDI